MTITSLAEQHRVAAAARKVGGYDKLIRLSEERERMSPNEWRKQYIQEFPPPEVIRMTTTEFANFRTSIHSRGLRIRISPCNRYWTINDAIVEFTTAKESDYHAAKRHRPAPRRTEPLPRDGEAEGLV